MTISGKANQASRQIDVIGFLWVFAHSKLLAPLDKL